jgi:hypothetical protein
MFGDFKFTLFLANSKASLESAIVAAVDPAPIAIASPQLETELVRYLIIVSFPKVVRRFLDSQIS